jgi:uncharacterized protein
MKNTPTPNFDCGKCYAPCCSIYEVVEVYAKDIRRLAGHFKLSVEETIKRYLRRDPQEVTQYVLRQKHDPLMEQLGCTFLNTDTRRCMIYDARPDVCRRFPIVSDRCGWWDAIQAQREHDRDPEAIILFQLKREPSAALTTKGRHLGLSDVRR